MLPHGDEYTKDYPKNSKDMTNYEIPPVPRIKIEDKEIFMSEHPDIKYFETIHPGGNITIWRKVHEAGTVPDNVRVPFGQYDSEGKFHFIDNDGWEHICYNPKALTERRRFLYNLRNKRKW